MPRERLGEILIKAGLLDDVGLQRALNEQARWGGQLGRYLVELGLITEETLVRALSTQYKLPAVALDPPRMNVSVGRLIPRDICERNSLICFRADVQKKFLDVAMSDPSNADALDEVRVATRFNVRPHIAAPTLIDKAISYVFYGDMSIGGEMDLSPQSSLRTDPRTSELVRQAGVQQSVALPPSPPPAPPPGPTGVNPGLGAGKPGQAWSPGVTPVAAGAKLEVQVSTTPSVSGFDPGSRPTISSMQAVKVMPPPRSDPGFHITLDVPAVDKEKLRAAGGSSIEERLTMLEATLARNTAVLQVLLEAMVKRGLLSREEAMRISTGTP